MSTFAGYKSKEDVPSAILADRLEQIVAQIEVAQKNGHDVGKLFSKTVPPQHDYDYDLVLWEVSRRLRTRRAGPEEWQPIETAPRNETEFLAKQDGEIYHAKSIDDRIVFRTHTLWEPRKYRRVKAKMDGKEVDALVLINEGPDEFVHSWTHWTRGFDFKPTHWMPLPETLENEGESQ